jgi:four helix bundle protein
MTREQHSREYDLQERRLAFAKRAIKFCRVLPKSTMDAEMGRQLVQSCTSAGANYIEANESLGKKDFLMRIRICRKEAKESGYWLRLVEPVSANLGAEHQWLLQESTELTKIFGSIVSRSDSANSEP